jgi:hypothetical protein
MNGSYDAAQDLARPASVWTNQLSVCPLWETDHTYPRLTPYCLLGPLGGLSDTRKAQRCIFFGRLSINIGVYSIGGPPLMTRVNLSFSNATSWAFARAKGSAIGCRASAGAERPYMPGVATVGSYVRVVNGAPGKTCIRTICPFLFQVVTHGASPPVQFGSRTGCPYSRERTRRRFSVFTRTDSDPPSGAGVSTMLISQRRWDRVLKTMVAVPRNSSILIEWTTEGK